jgi:hypothetical protein
MSKYPDTLKFMSNESRMSAHDRTGSIWVRLARTAGIAVKRDLTGLWAVVKGPAIAELSQISPCRTEMSAWQFAAHGVAHHLCRRLTLSKVQWQQKTPTQQLELIHAFFEDAPLLSPDETFEQEFTHRAKALCRGAERAVTRCKSLTGSTLGEWNLNQGASFFFERDAWQAGADDIRRQVMKRASLSYVDWVKLSLDDQILMAQEYTLCDASVLG